MTIPTESTGERSPEQLTQTLDDNARKFTVDAIDATLYNTPESTSYLMSTDWLVIGESEETKVVHKKFSSDKPEILLIKKVMKDGKRTSDKKKLQEEEYSELVTKSKVHSEKIRTEFTYPQHGIDFSMKFDQFTNSTLCVLEVDAPTEEERASFDYQSFPAKLSEVTGNLQYYGFRVASLNIQ